MKRFDLPNTLINGILSVCLGMAVGGCIVTAFSLNANLLPSFLICLVWAAVCLLLLPLRRGWIALPAGLLLWGWLLWELDAHIQFGTMLQTCFDFYNRAYGTRIPTELQDLSQGNVSLAISVVCGIVTILCSLSLEHLRSGALSICCCVLILMPCFIVTDTVPHTGFLFLLISIVAILVLTDNVRLRDPRQANRLTAMLLLPVILANFFLFRLNPRDSYDKQPDLQWLQTLPDRLMPTFQPATLPTFTAPDWNLSDNVALQTVGPKNPSHEPVMEVDTNLKGILYLRGKSYCGYDGFSWDAEAPVENALQFASPIYFESAVSDTKLYVEFHILQTQSYRFAPYYPLHFSVLVNGAFFPGDQSRFYRVSVDPLRADWRNLYFDITLAQMKNRDDRPKDFLKLPQNTLTRAKAFLKENNIHDQLYVLDAAQQIADLVRSSARYDLNTGYMPAGEKDFALWFLENSDTGYCVHFATAAAVLLRAAGIPARYVEGYVTRVDGNGHSRVTSNQAHAWVEYFVPELGWLMLEPTPAAGWEPPIETLPPTEPTTRPTEPTTRPTVPTTPPATEPTTGPTVPTDPADTVPTVTAPSSTAPTGSLMHPVATAPPSIPPIPSVTFPDPTGQDQALVRLGMALRILTALLAAVALCIGQWWLRKIWIHKRLHSGSANTQALRRWRFAKRLAKLRRQDAPEALRELAQKAKFSQHTISPEELAMFDGYFDRSIRHLRSRPWPLRLLYRLLFAAY